MMTRIVLTDTEWMRLIDGVREDSDLPRCCANISELRSSIIGLARNGGQVNGFDRSMLEQRFSWCFPSHGPLAGAILSLAEQLNLKTADDESHDPQKEEL